MKIQLEKDEYVIREGGANHFVGMEAVGGKLFLTNRRLYFNSHDLNVQVHELSIPIVDIVSAGTRNTLGVVPNGLLVKLKGGTEERYVVWGRKKWIEEIENLLRGMGKE